ncbi:MAG TPA: hypothetical protein VNA14_12780 [Mycobacteriales bacterium]|nr:hypothetical protein [Mycobacteriales bacterium]
MSRAAALHLDGVFALVVYGLIITALAVTFAASYLRPSRPARSNPGGNTMVPSRTRLYTGVGLLTLAAIVGAVGWYKISGEPALNRQVPLLASAGMAVVLLSVAGGALLVADQLRGDDRRLDDLETAVTQLAAALAPSIESPPRLRGTTAIAGTPSPRAAAVVKPSPGAEERARVASAQVTPEPAPVPPSAPAALKAAEPAKAAAKITAPDKVATKAAEPAKASEPAKPAAKPGAKTAPAVASTTAAKPAKATEPVKASEPAKETAAVETAPALASTTAAKKPAKATEPVKAAEKSAEPAKETAAVETAADVTTTAPEKPAAKAAAKKAPTRKPTTKKAAAKKPATKAPVTKPAAKKSPAKKATAPSGLFRPAGTTRQVVRPAPGPVTEPAADVPGEAPAVDQAVTTSSSSPS